MLPEDYDKYQIIPTRTISYIVVKMFMATKFKVSPALKKLIIFVNTEILKFLKEKNKLK